MPLSTSVLSVIVKETIKVWVGLVFTVVNWSFRTHWLMLLRLIMLLMVLGVINLSQNAANVLLRWFRLTSKLGMCMSQAQVMAGQLASQVHVHLSWMRSPWVVRCIWFLHLLVNRWCRSGALHGGSWVNRSTSLTAPWERGQGGGVHRLVVGLWGQVLTQVMAHVLLTHHDPRGWKLGQLWQLWPNNGVFSVFGSSVFAQVFSGWEKFTTFVAGNFLSVRSILANSHVFL